MYFLMYLKYSPLAFGILSIIKSIITHLTVLVSTGPQLGNVSRNLAIALYGSQNLVH